MNTTEIKKQLALEYVKEQVNVGRHPSYKEINKKFNIIRYGIKLSDLYPPLGISLLELKCKRPNASMGNLKPQLINFVKEQAQKEIYPTRRFIENNFRVRLTGLFSSIKDLYKQAGIGYVLKCNQELKCKKAVILQKIVLDLLPALGLTLVKERRTHDRGVDLITIDQNGNVIGVEIKAHHKYEPIKKRNISQLKRFLEQENLNKIILITTSSLIKAKIDDDKIMIIDFDALRKVCNPEQLKLLEQIRNEVVHQETHEKERMRTQILEYAAEEIRPEGRITHLGLSNRFHIHVFNYFKSIQEIYDRLGLLPPLDQMESSRRSSRLNLAYRNKVLDQMVNYIKEEVAKEHYPNGIEVGHKFGSSRIWNFVTMTELYQRAGLKSYLERRRTGEYNKKIQGQEGK